MSPVLRKRSLSDMQHADSPLPAEFSDRDYIVEVLQLDEGQTEALVDESLTMEAERLGITISRPNTPSDERRRHATHDSLCESAGTTPSHHRTASSGSHGSASTGITSRSSNEQLDNQQARKRSSARRSLSFTEYEKYLAQYGAHTTKPVLPPPPPAEPAPSIFSVSTRKSYVSIKNGFRNRFKMRRTKSSQEDSK